MVLSPTLYRAWIEMLGELAFGGMVFSD